MILIERAIDSDFVDLHELIETTFVETWTGLVTDDHIRRHLADGHALGIVSQFSAVDGVDLFVVRGQDSLLGYAIGLLSADDNPSGLCNFYKLEKIYLRTSAKGRGIGLRLWNVMLKNAIALGADGIYLTHYPLNERASRFYQRLGLKKVGQSVYRCGAGEYNDWVLAAPVSELLRLSASKGIVD